MRERLFQFFQLRCRAMHFHPGDISHFEHLREERADVIEMRKNAFSFGVRFAAENFVAVDSEPVEQILCVGRGVLDEARLSVVWPQLRRARSAPVLLQFEARLVRELLRHRSRDGRLRCRAERRGGLVE